MTTQSDQPTSFLESFGRTLGNLRMGLQSPLMEKTIELQLQKEKRQYEEKIAREQAAIEILEQLDRQKELAADWQKDYGNKPEAAGLHGPIPEWGKADQLREYQSYGQAGLDPQAIAKTEKERMMTDLFEQSKNHFADNPYIQAGLSLGVAPKAIELEDGQFYNPNVQKDFLLGTTGKNQAETKLKQSEAAEQALRLERIRQLSDPLMQINATSNKELGKPMEAEIEGPNGETHKALITQDSSGRYHHSTVTDKEGKPLVIPPEAVGGGSSGLTTDQKNVKYYSQLWGKTEAETAEILKSKSLYSDAGFIEERLTANSEGRWGRADDKTIFNQTFDDFTRARYGSYFPSYFETLVKSSDMTEVEKEHFTQRVKDYNLAVFEMGLAGKAPPAAATTTVQTPPIPQPAAPAVTVQAPPVQPVVPPVPIPQPAAPAATVQAPPLQPVVPPVPIPQPAAQAPIPEPPPAPDFMAFAETVMTNDSPATINAALKKQGFDLSSQAMGAMAIDAINQGVSVQDIQQLYQLLGIQWTPPA